LVLSFARMYWYTKSKMRSHRDTKSVNPISLLRYCKNILHSSPKARILATSMPLGSVLYTSALSRSSSKGNNTCRKSGEQRKSQKKKKENFHNNNNRGQTLSKHKYNSFGVSKLRSANNKPFESSVSEDWRTSGIGWQQLEPSPDRIGSQ